MSYENKGSMAATVVVSIEPDRSGNFVCDGTADDVEINAAIAALPAGGGEVHLLEGTFYITASINMVSSSSLVGSGRGTVLTIPDSHDDNLNVILCDTVDRVRIAHLTIDGNKAEQGAGIMVGIYWDYVTYSLIENVGLENMTWQGLYNLTYCDHNVIVNCTVYGNDREGLDFTGICQYNIIANNQIVGNGLSGVTFNATNIDHNIVIGNNILDNDRNGILVGSDCHNNVIVGNFIASSDWEGIFVGIGSTRNLISGNVIELSTLSGIKCDQAPYNKFIGNVITTNTQHGINLGSSDNCTVTGNTCYQNIRNGISSSGDDCDFIGNQCNENDLNNTATYSGMSINGDDNFIHNNTCDENDLYGIDVSGLRNWVKNNHLIGNTSGPFLEGGTDTKLATLVLSFVDGTTFLTSAPFGWEIDASAEYAIALGHLPLEVQEVVRWKIWATSLVADAEAMRLEIEGYGGASNEPYTTETVVVADHPSETTNFAVNDVIYWLLDASDDTDIDEMVGGDQVMIKVIHEAAGGDDVETDAVFTCVELEYV